MRLLLAVVLVASACDSGSKSATPAVGSAAQPAFLNDLPRVVRTPALISDPVDPVVVVTATSITLEGRVVATVANGDVSAADKEGGAQGMKILPLAKALEQLPKTGKPLAIAMARTLPHRLLVEILSTAKQKEAGFKTFHFLVTDGNVPLAIPLTLPDKSSPSGFTLGGPIADAPSKGPAGRISVGDKSGTGDSSLTPEMVLSKILSAYMAGLKRCYKDTLKKDPAAKGKVTLTLTVDKTGRTQKANAKGFSTEIDNCMSGGMASWRFPIPKDADGEPTDATFSITLQLVPDTDSDAAKDKATHEADKADQEAAARYADMLTGEGKEKAPAEGRGQYADAIEGERVEGDKGSGAAAAAPLLQDPDRMPLGIIVSVSKDEILVWSITGMEGTLSQPRLKVSLADTTSMKQLNTLLADTVNRRWAGKERPPATNSIIVMADPSTPVQTIADVFVAVRSTVDGTKLLFPEILLAVGFE